MPEKSRRRVLLAGGLVIIVGCIVFGLGINWGLPSHAIDPFLFGSGPDSATTSIKSYLLSGVGISRLAGDWDQNSNLAADVAAHPIHDRSNPVTLLENRRGSQAEHTTGPDDVARARILRRYRLYSFQPDEMISFRALAMMHPAKLQFDPKLYQYGGLWIYPLGIIIKTASLLGYATVSGDPTFYLDSPEAFGRFYILARAYSAVWGVVGALAVLTIARRMGGRLLLPFLAGLCFICLPVVVDLAHEAKPHLAGTAILLLSILPAIKYVETGRWKWMVGTAVLCGACAGMVLSGVIALAVLPAMCFVRRDCPGRFAKICAGGVVIAAIVYFATNPYVAVHLLGDPAVLKSNLENSRAMYSVTKTGSSFSNAFYLIVAGISWPVAVLGAAAVAGLVLKGGLRGNGWVIAIPALLVLIQFSLLAANKPGEYARFGLFTDVALMLAAFIFTARFIRPIAIQAAIGILLVASAALYSAAYEYGFLRDCSPDNSRAQAAAIIDRRLAQTPESPVLYVTAEPAPYCLPPLNLFRWRMILLPPDGDVPTGFPAGIRVQPASAIDVLNPRATPISWANIEFPMADTQRK